jgi:putative membrane protein
MSRQARPPARPVAVASLVAGLAPGEALAHADHLTATWSFDPWIVIPLALSAALYTLGTTRLWRHAGTGRGIHPWQVGCYGAGWLLLAGALVSPLHWMGEHLFTAHMVEHEIIIAAAAPLLALARPVGAFLWALPAPLRRRLARTARHRPIRTTWITLTSPVPATIWHGAVIWVWHAPILFGGLSQRVFIAGVLPNTADNLVNWIVQPRTYSPGSAMPVTGISKAEARDIAAWLYAH